MHSLSPNGTRADARPSSRARSLRFWLVMTALGVAPASAVIGLELHVDPRLGSDLHEGTVSAPVRSLTRAFALVEDAFAARPTDAEAPDAVTIVLAAGRYRSGEGETFPLVVPAGPRALRLEGARVGGVTELDAGLFAGCILLADALTSGGPLPSEIAIDGVSFLAGNTGVQVIGERGDQRKVAFTRCRFARQKVRGIAAGAAEAGRLEVTVEDCVFETWGLYPLDLTTRRASELVVEVLDTRVLGLPDTSGLPLRNGIALFLDEGATIEARVERALLSDTGNGVLLSGAENPAIPGVFDLTLANSSVVGNPDPARNGLEHGLYLSLPVGHRGSLRLRHNTFAGGRGAGFYFERPATEPEARYSCELIDLDLVGNVVFGFDSGMLSVSEAGEGFPSCTRLEGNAWDRRHGTTGPAAPAGLEIGPADLAWSEGHYAPAPGSRLIDRGELAATRDPDERDGRGGCRVADGDGDGVFRIDLGAVEASGPCGVTNGFFVRGDCSMDAAVDLADVFYSLTYLFVGGVEPSCLDACDFDDDGLPGLTDGILTLDFLFSGGPPPSPPYPAPGFDPTPDELETCVR